MGFEEPICGVGGTVTTCAYAALAQANESAAARTANCRTLGEEIAVMGGVFLSALPKMPLNISRQILHCSSQNDHILHFFDDFFHFMCNLVFTRLRGPAHAAAPTGVSSGLIRGRKWKANRMVS
jgi:hypothetical protein